MKPQNDSFDDISHSFPKVKISSKTICCIEFVFLQVGLMFLIENCLFLQTLSFWSGLENGFRIKLPFGAIIKFFNFEYFFYYNKNNMSKQLISAFVISIIFSYALIGQEIIQYDLSSRTSIYSPLENGALALPAEEQWEPFATTFAVDLGFEFNMLGTPTTGLENFITTGILTILDSENVPENTPFPVIITNAFQFENRAEIPGNDPSLIRYETIGEPGEQIFKIEYANAGYLIELEELGTLDLFFNMQVWLYEGSNCIELRYGPNNIEGSEDFILDEASGFVTGLVVSTLAQVFGAPGRPYAIFPTGDTQNPVEDELVDFMGTLEENPFLDDFPTDGLLFSFCPEGVDPPVNTNDLLLDLDWNLYPNPVDQVLTIDFQSLDNGRYELLSTDGVLMKTGQINQGQILIDVSGLASGHYITKVTTDEGFAAKRFFKTNN